MSVPVLGHRSLNGHMWPLEYYLAWVYDALPPDPPSISPGQAGTGNHSAPFISSLLSCPKHALGAWQTS